MITPDGIPAAPPPEQRLWRYVDVPRFLAVCEDRALFFNRASTFADTFEGSFPQGQSQIERITGMVSGVSPEEIVEISPDFGDVWTTLRKWAYVSCWHISDSESAAMWSLYARDNASMALQTTVQRLADALGKPPAIPEGFFGSEDYVSGSVSYIDYATARIPLKNALSPLFHKRRSFDHEKEFRVLLSRFPVTSGRGIEHSLEPEEPGMLLPVDLSILLERITISPAAPEWFFALIAKIAARYELKCPIVRSELAAMPNY
jgi:hypothetical protein